MSIKSITSDQNTLAVIDDSFLNGNGEMAALIRSRDWSSTSLGPISSWPQSLRTVVSLCLASNFPINIVWGANYAQIGSVAKNKKRSAL